MTGLACHANNFMRGVYFTKENWHNRDIAPFGAISRVVNPLQSPTATPLRHLSSLGENSAVNNCGMYDSF